MALLNATIAPVSAPGGRPQPPWVPEGSPRQPKKLPKNARSATLKKRVADPAAWGSKLGRQGLPKGTSEGQRGGPGPPQAALRPPWSAKGDPEAGQKASPKRWISYPQKEGS